MKRKQNAGSISMQLRAAEAKREEVILERIRMDALRSSARPAERQPAVTTATRQARRLTRR